MLAVAQNNTPDVAHARTVNENLTGGNRAAPFAGRLRQLEHLADVRDEDILCVHAERLRKPRMRLQMALLAVERNEKARMQQRVHDLQLLLAGVTGDVQTLELVVDDLCALAVELVDDLADGLFIAWNGGGGDNHAVARLNFHLPVPGERHAVKRRHVFALRAGRDNDNLVLWQ